MGLDAVIQFRLPIPADGAVEFPARVAEFERRLRDLLHDDVDVAPARPTWSTDLTGFDVYEVATAFRYWAPEYERGPLAKLLFILDYTQVYFASDFVTVFYGHDSGGAIPEWTAARRTELLAHACVYEPDEPA